MTTDQCHTNTLISTEEALQNIYCALDVIQGEETINLPCALSRVLTENCIAPFDLPAFENSSMDD